MKKATTSMAITQMSKLKLGIGAIKQVVLPLLVNFQAGAIKNPL